MAKDGFSLNMTELKRIVSSTLDGLSKTEDLMEEIGQHMQSEILIAMDAEQSLDGDQWAKGNRSGQALRQTNKLHGSITYEATSDSVAVGVGKAAEDRYPEVHNEGMVIKPKTAKALRFQLPSGRFVTVKQVTIPKREFIPDFAESPRAQDEIRQVCEEYMQQIMGL